MTTDEEFGDLTGCPAVGADGETAGTVARVYVSEVTSRPGWVLIATRPGGSADRFAPLAGARVTEGRLVFAVPARVVAGAPQPGLDSRGYLPQAGAGVLDAYYNPYLPRPQAAGPARAGSDAVPGGSRPDEAADGYMIVSEERLRTGTETVVSGRARLVRYTVTRQVTLTVSVSHEEVRVELEPLPAGDAEPPAPASTEAAGSAGGPDGKWMILHAERPVVHMESVPVERVRLRVETVAGQQQVTAQVRKERIAEPETEPLPRPDSPA